MCGVVVLLVCGYDSVRIENPFVATYVFTCTLTYFVLYINMYITIYVHTYIQEKELVGTSSEWGGSLEG